MLHLYLLSKVNETVVELVLHIGGLSTESDVIRGPSVHHTGCQTLSGNVSVAVEGELDLLGLTREQRAVEGKDVKYLQHQ